MTQQEMQSRIQAHQKESTAFIFSPEWINMNWPERDAKEDEINTRHSYKHGWIIVDGHSFNRAIAFPDEKFYNVWD